jgi:hypothetical protein
LTLSAQKFFRIDSALFQIEYLFRDRKSHLGLGPAHVQKEATLNFQNNAYLNANFKDHILNPTTIINLCFDSILSKILL